MAADPQLVIMEEETFLRAIGVAFRQASWDFSATGDLATQPQVAELGVQYRRRFADQQVPRTDGRDAPH